MMQWYFYICNFVSKLFVLYLRLRINLLFRSVYIVRLLSGLMLMVFALSITPKRFLHNVFAKHIDSKPGRTSDKPYQLSNSGYNCDSDNLVAESTFLNDLPSFQFPVCTYFSCYVVKNISYSSISTIYSPLRGPPVRI
jgi:hypothetical protein